MDTPILALDPGRLTGFALLQGKQILALGATVQDDLLPLLDTLSQQECAMVVESWEVRGVKPGRHSVVPNQVIGMLLGYAYCNGIEVYMYTSRWKRGFVGEVDPIPPRVVERLDRSDRALLAKVMQTHVEALELIKGLPKDHRPHALDALGLALYHAQSQSQI